jgi:hypothetical protein
MLNGLLLTADDEALHQRFGKMRRAHALLHGGNVVGHAPELDGLMFEIGNSKTGAGITIARLADGAGIEEVAARLFDAQRGERFRRPRTNLKHFEIGILIREAALVMSVAEKSDFGGGIEEAVKSLRGREDVFIFILKRAVHQNDPVCSERAVRQLGEPREILCVQLRTSPIHGSFRNGIEIGGVHEAGDSFVMIAANGLRTKFAKAGDHLMGIGPIADDIAETHGNIPAAFRRIQSSGESCGVCVKIAKNKNAHSCHPQNAIEYR